ncbi:WG repeat-containing protein [Mucilaginibacter sp. Bleaf8]|uniref:WG repeat-containing protein n=1 Tax=Mucilaginibacter sp. Bleaf8 TaxID=2834430 RepID=UPI001BCDE675|nr:WG repeat-containing protein [Mucilaginibacter sp. Bleaf8]MBS7566215.1 WG repeat-containing protein [Mucilaginibacter sp. Bleaf8]
MQLKFIIAFLCVLSAICSCKTKPADGNYYLIEDTAHNTSGYLNANKDTVIPLGKYDRCLTDTFKNFAIVAKRNVGFIGIDKAEKVLFEVFPFDNGPDYVVEGLFRIIKNGKIGYADSTGKVIIPPRYACAYPFEKGLAMVSYQGKKIADGEHYYWAADHWFYINKAGQEVKKK